MDEQIKAWADQVRAAGAGAKALRIRGGGSKDFYGREATGEVLDTRAHHGVPHLQHQQGSRERICLHVPRVPPRQRVWSQLRSPVLFSLVSWLRHRQ